MRGNVDRRKEIGKRFFVQAGCAAGKGKFSTSKLETLTQEN